MLDVRKIFQSYLSAGAFNSLLTPTAFISENTFITKSGDLGMVLKLEGIDFECLTEELLEEQAQRFTAALRSLDEQFRIYQYVVKREKVAIPHKPDYGNPLVQGAIQARVNFLEAKGLPEHDLFLAIVYEGKQFLSNPQAKVKELIRTAFTDGAQITIPRKKLQRDIRLLSQRVNGFLTSTKDFLHTKVLNNQEQFTFFRRLYNLTPGKAEVVPLKYNQHVDYFLTDSQMKVTDLGLLMEGQHVHLYSLKEEPSRTHVNLLQALYQLPCSFIVCSEYKRTSNLLMRNRIKTRQRHYDAARFSFISLMGSKPVSELKEDQSANEHIEQLDEALKEIEVRGNYFGEFALTIVLYSRDEKVLMQAGAELTKLFGELDASLIHETMNAPLVYAAICPGGSKWQHRQISLLNLNYTDLGLFYAIHQGYKVNKYIQDEYLSVYETNQGTPYYLNLHTEDLIGALITGAPGSGKSVQANYLLSSSQKYHPYTLILDIGGSYQETTRNFGGEYAHVDLENLRSNPFSLPESKTNMDFQKLLVTVLLRQNGCTVDGRAAEEIFQAIRRLYQSDPAYRTLAYLVSILPVSLKRDLQPWVGEGQFGQVFNSVEDHLTLARFQCFDLKGMEKKTHLVQPFLFYVLHRFSTVVNDPAHLDTLKILWIDESWKVLQDQACRDYVIEAGKTWRKSNGGIVLITQSLTDLEQSAGLLEIVNSVCPMKMFLADPGADRKRYAQVFHLNEREMQLLGTLTPKQQLLLKTPTHSKILSLNLDPISYWLYTTKPSEIKQRREVFAQYGPAQGLNILASAATPKQLLAATA